MGAEISRVFVVVFTNLLEYKSILIFKYHEVITRKYFKDQAPRL